MERDSYLGRILTGRIYSGIVHIGDKIHGLRESDSGTVKIEEGKVCHCQWLLEVLINRRFIIQTKNFYIKRTF